MTRVPRLALVLLLAPWSPVAAQSYDTVNDALVGEVVVPAYERYARAIERLPAAIEALCESPDEGHLKAAQQAWREATLAWQHAQPIRVGPVIDQGLEAQIAFWPDKHGTAGRQFNRALASRDQSLLDPAELPGKSVGLTSMVNLERLLFGDALLDPDLGGYACAYGLAVARHQVDLADGLLAAWTGPDGFRTVVATAGPDNDVYFSAYDPAATLYRSIADALDGVVQIKLEPPLGESIEATRGKQAENWRSHMALPGIAANLGTARDLYATDGGFGDLYLYLGGDPAVDQEVRAGFEAAIQTTRDVPLPLVDAVEDPAARSQVVALVDEVKQLRALIRGPVASGLGLSLGFNATDGD